MRLSTFCFPAVLIAAITAFARPAASQAIPSPYTYLERAQEIGVYGGYATSGTGRFGFGPSGGPTLGVRYGLELTGPISLEGVAGVIEGTRDVVDPGRIEGDRVIGEADSRIMTIDARLKFSFAGRRAWHGLSPFIVAGGGIAFDLAPRSEFDDVLLPEDVFDFGTSFYGTLGGGARYFITERFAIRGDGLFSLWQIDTPPGFSDPERGFVGVEDGEWVGGSVFSVSLLFRW